MVALTCPSRWHCLLTIVPVVFANLAQTSVALLIHPTTLSPIQQRIWPIHDTMNKSSKVGSTRLTMVVDDLGTAACPTRRELLKALLAASAGTSTIFYSRPSRAEEGGIPTEDISGAIEEDWSNVEIMKAPLDDRDYAVYIMPNQLKVILCSDPTSNEGGASMDVQVGACSDPPGINGLAHFNEHMLFLGTEVLLITTVSFLVDFLALLLKLVLIVLLLLCFSREPNEQEISKRRFIRKFLGNARRCFKCLHRFRGHRISLYNGRRD